MDVATFFDTQLPAAMADQPAKVKRLGTRYSIHVVDVGDWAIDCTAVTCQRGSLSGDDVTTAMLTADEMERYLDDPRTSFTLMARRTTGARFQGQVMKLANLIELHTGP